MEVYFILYLVFFFIASRLYKAALRCAYQARIVPEKEEIESIKFRGYFLFLILSLFVSSIFLFSCFWVNKPNLIKFILFSLVSVGIHYFAIVTIANYTYMKRYKKRLK